MLAGELSPLRVGECRDPLGQACSLLLCHSLCCRRMGRAGLWCQMYRSLDSISTTLVFSPIKWE